MPKYICQIIPDADTLLALEPEELAGVILEHLNSLPEQSKNRISRYNFSLLSENDLNVRDYFVADFQVELPPISLEEISKTDKIPGKDIVDIDLIKLNIPAILLTYILKSIFSKQKIVLIQDNKFLHNHIHNFFNYITKNSFEIDIIIITEEMYKNDKKTYKDSMVFRGINILRNVKNIIIQRNYL